MNDFFIKILIRQRHEEIFSQVRAARRPQRGRSGVTPGRRRVNHFVHHRLRVKAHGFRTAGVVERRPV